MKLDTSFFTCEMDILRLSPKSGHLRLVVLLVVRQKALPGRSIPPHLLPSEIHLPVGGINHLHFIIIIENYIFLKNVH